MNLQEAARKMKLLSPRLGALTTTEKNKALLAMARKLEAHASAIRKANDADLEAAEVEGLEAPLKSRLKFQGEKLAGVIVGLESLAGLPDPVGKTLSARELDSGLELYQVTCPIGVIGMIFESRPDALVQIASLALKSGNALILKGGREAQHTNKVLFDLIVEATKEAGIPEGWIFLATSREEVGQMLALDRDIDLLIPRGSNEFVKYIMTHTSIPVLGHADGITHCYIDKRADVEMAIKIVLDSKTQYVAVCNALETLLVHQDIAPYFLQPLKLALESRGVELRGCPVTRKILGDIKPASEEDWKTEYLDYILSIKTVKSMDEALEHIAQYSSRHTETIVTDDRAAALKFMDLADSGNVFWNASTRFSDGFRYGLGAEVGVSTGKIHARGPVGLEGLVIYKWKLFGQGQVVGTYSGANPKPYTHRTLQKDCPK